MMNNLNSILLEGVLLSDAEGKTDSRGMFLGSFVVVSKRQSENEIDQAEVSRFEVEIYGEKAKACLKELSQDRAVRVVGRLKQCRQMDEAGNVRSRVIVVAEHLEFRPLIKSKS